MCIDCEYTHKLCTKYLEAEFAVLQRVEILKLRVTDKLSIDKIGVDV